MLNLYYILIWWFWFFVKKKKKNFKHLLGCFVMCVEGKKSNLKSKAYIFSSYFIVSGAAQMGGSNQRFPETPTRENHLDLSCAAERKACSVCSDWCGKSSYSSGQSVLYVCLYLDYCSIRWWLLCYDSCNTWVGGLIHRADCTSLI